MLTRKLSWASRYWVKYSSGHLFRNERSLSVLCQYLNINESKAEYLRMKHPVLNKITSSSLVELILTLKELGYTKEVLVEEPLLFSILPKTLKMRHQVLQECAIVDITPKHLVSYLTLIKRNTVGQLKNEGVMIRTINIENRLASYMTQWPTSLTTLIYGDVNECTLYVLRLKIIQRYLELILDLMKEEFQRGIETYPNIKHRPLAVINDTLNILQSQIMMPTHKIKSNLYLVHADPDNLKNIIYKFQSIGGIDIKEIIRKHPKIALKNCSTLFEIRNVLLEYNIGNEAQRRCFEIYTLSPETIKKRIENAKSIPEFSTFFNHPRFLKMIFYNNTAKERLMKLIHNNKKCVSLNILSGSSEHFETFEKAPGDRLGKGKDLVFYLTQKLGKAYKNHEIFHSIKRHPFWINIPLVQIQYVHEKLSKEFTADDILKNSPILLYPWNKIREVLNLFEKSKEGNIFPFHHENLDLTCLSKSQKLSMILYLLEKNHYFTGNGVWVEEKVRNPENFTNRSVNTN